MVTLVNTLSYKIYIVNFFRCFFVLLAGIASAGLFSESAKLGANLGAMQYCADRFAGDGDSTRYNLIKLKILDEYGNLPSDDKAKALLLRKKAEDEGDNLGDQLDAGRCDSIHKMLYLKY